VDGQTVNIIVIAISVGLSAFFSSAEAAFLTLQGSPRLQHLVSTGNPGARRVASMLDRPERLLSTILLGNNLVNILFATLVTIVTLSVIDDEAVGVIVATVAGTSILLVLGEVIPKAFAVRYAERVAIAYARPLQTVEFLMWPVVVVLQSISKRVVPGRSQQELDAPSITEGELRTLIDIGEAEGAFEPEEAELLENVFRFGDRQVREVMTPRTEMTFVKQGATLTEFLRIYTDNNHTRFPVYEGEVENVLGIISSKDVLNTLAARTVRADESVTGVTRPTHFVPETKRAADLFEELRASGNQMAIVVDEFGGLAGLVTLKRLLEELAGPVGEEGEAPEEEYEAIDDFTFQVDGAMDIEEANEELQLHLPDGEDFETVAGFVLDALGHIPSEGEQFEYRGLRFEVVEMKGLKVETIRLTKPGSQRPESALPTDDDTPR
jgi:putative hemolysin